MVTIDRSLFVFDAALDGYRGRLTLDGRLFEVFVKAWSGNWEAAWGKAEQGARVFLKCVAEIETAVKTQLAPELDHWTEERITVAEITRRVMQTMRSTAVVGLHACEDSASLYFDGPALVLGHHVEVALCKDGTLSVGLAG